MKLFSVVNEGDRLSDSLFTLVLPRKNKNILNKVKRPFFFNLHITTKPYSIYPNTDLIVRRSVRYKYPLSLKFKKICYLSEYSFLEDPVSGMSGFLKEKDIRKDAGICIWGDFDPKEFSVKD